MRSAAHGFFLLRSNDAAIRFPIGMKTSSKSVTFVLPSARSSLAQPQSHGPPRT
jgi:hypothetical protein